VATPFYLQQLARAIDLTTGQASAAAELSLAIEVPLPSPLR
jgi:hypothetical protein